MADAEFDGASDSAPAPISDITALRRQQRSREYLAARQCMVALVDYLAGAANVSEPPRRIGEIAEMVLKRSGALAAARQFIRECEAETVRDHAE